jgi:hypothetical protein
MVAAALARMELVQKIADALLIEGADGRSVLMSCLLAIPAIWPVPGDSRIMPHATRLAWSVSPCYRGFRAGPNRPFGITRRAE